jgi:endonuclease/exonuclease/phosphatase family metal-dependent hydrolase
MKLKIMSYNIAGGRSFEFGPDYRPIIHAEAQYGAYIKAQQPDVCGLNEVDYKLPRSGRVEMAKLIGDVAGYESAFAPAVSFINKYGIGTYGNGFVTKHKIKLSETYPIPDPTDKTGDPENTYYESRAVLHVLVEIGGRDVDIFVSHFGLAPSEAKNAVMTMTSLIKQAKNPVIVMGDFNLTPDSPILDPIRELLTDTFDVFPGKKATTCPSSTTYWPDADYGKIDYIFVSNHFKVESVEIPELVLSDHKPYIAYLELPDEA